MSGTTNSLKKSIVLGIAALFLATACAYSVAEAQDDRRRPLRDWIKQKREQRTSTDSAAAVDSKEIKPSYQNFREAPFGPGDYSRSIEHGGMSRYYEMHVPPGYSDDRSMPLVLVFHGGAGNPSQQRHDSQMDAVADANGFIVVYPAGTGRSRTRLLTYNAGICCGSAKKNNVDDVGFTVAVLDDVNTLFNLNNKKVYATGFSNGAFMVYRLACEIADKIAAIGPVSGVLGVDGCRPSRPVSIVHFHGKQDPNAVYDGGIGPNAKEKIPRRGVRETIDIFLHLYGLPAQPVETSKTGQVLSERWASGKVEIVVWTIDDGGHTWPGGKTTISESKVGKLSTAIDASELMWQFFEHHSLP